MKDGVDKTNHIYFSRTIGWMNNIVHRNAKTHPISHILRSEKIKEAQI